MGSTLNVTGVPPQPRQPALVLTLDEANRLKCGQYISALQLAKRLPVGGIAEGEVFCARTDREMIALAKFEGNQIRPVRVMNFYEDWS